MEPQGLTLTTVRQRLAAIAAAHRLRGHEDPASLLLIKATMNRLAREYGKPCKQANGLTSEALAAVKATARIQRVHQGKHRRKETESQNAMRAAVDLALLEVMRDGLLRLSEASALYLGPAAVDALLAIRPDEAVIDPGARVFGLSARQISRRIKAATKRTTQGCLRA